MKKYIVLGITLLTCYSQAETYEWGNVRFDGGGFVSAILPHPAQEGLIYARTDVGGIYRFDAKENVWIPLMDEFNENDKGLYGTESFAIDPTDPKRIYVLAGTGYFSKGRTAVLRSEDYGNTWDTTYVEMLAHGNGMGRQTGEKLAVDPNKPNIILCGSRTKGIYKSTDYGKSWSSLYKVALSSATESALNNVNGVSFILFDGTQGKLSDGSSSVIYVGISEKTDNLQVSKDGGETWSTITGGPNGLMPHRAKIVGDEIFITYADGPGPYQISQGGVFKYNIKSNTWTEITPYDDNEKEGGQIVHEKNACPYGGIAIDPKDKNHIVVSTLGQYTGRHHYSDDTENYGDRIYVTTDGGKNWTHGQHYDDGFNVETNGSPWIHGNAIHWAGSLEFDPFDNKKVWVTSGNGIFQTDDITQNVPIWKFQSKGIEETVPLDILSIPGGPLVTAIGDYDGGIYDNINDPVKRHTPIVGTTESIGYAPLSKSLVRTGIITVYGQYESINYNVMYRSEDYGNTWDSVKTNLKGGKGLVVLSADGKVMLHRPDQSASVYRSDDNGGTWSEVKTGEQTNYSRIVADPINPSVFYVMNSMGTLYKSTDAGKSFVAEPNRLQNESAGEYYNGGNLIRTVPGKEGHLWVPMDQAQVWLPKGFSENGLAYTEDGGGSWNHCDGASTAISVGLGKAKEGSNYETIYIWGSAKSGDPIGIYRSTDKCKTFERINDDKHQFGGPGNGGFVVGDMNTYGVVYMSTVGRGIIAGAPQGTIIQNVKKNYMVNFNPTVQLQLSKQTLYVNVPENSYILLFDSKGSIKQKVKVSGNSIIPLASFNSGIYFAKVISKNGATLLIQKINVR